MATYNKFNIFLFDCLLGEHQFQAAGDTFRLYLTNAAPDAEADAVKADLAEFAGGTGYTAGGEDIQNDLTRSTGTATVTAVDVTWTAGGTWAAFTYIVLYNDTATTKTDPLVAWWQYSSALTMQNGDTFKADFGTEVFHIT